MADQPSKGPRTAGILLGTLCGLLWILVVAPLSDLGRSDPAGNAMAAGFAGLGIILLWILLSILALVAAIKGTMPSWARPALLLVPASGAAALGALELLPRPGNPPGHWPLIIPLLAPPLIVTYCVWALRWPMNGRVAAPLLGALAVLTAAIVPFYMIRSTTIAQQESTAASQRAALAALPADAPLWAFTPFLTARDLTIVAATRERIRALPRRQADAETMLARGDFPLSHLGSFGLDLTPAVCENARALLRKRAAELVLATPGSKPFSDIREDVAGALNALYWLIGYGCDAGAEALAWETMTKGYREPNYDVVLLPGLREPGKLGKTLREDPERFSQLNAQSHLKAWLKFSDDAPMRERVIAGARTLPNRTADAIAILSDKYQESGRFRLFRILPAIDLEATPALCAAAAREIGTVVKGVYRPGADDPRAYSELIDRLGVGRPLNVLIWLGEHGCDVTEALRAAETAVRAYRDSPGRAEMLSTLARLQRK
jgi:hypothetical protein